MKVSIINTNGGAFPVVIPNQTIDGEGFYISYNAVDVGIYGSDTTALVSGQMEKFHILNGDHRAEYLSLIDKGFSACFDYFVASQDVMNRYSDKPTQ